MKLQDIPLHKFYPPQEKPLLNTKGRKLVKEIGLETIRDVILDVLCGENIRKSTEIITRKRIALSNAALISLFLKGDKEVESFFEDICDLSSGNLQKKLKKEDKWILEWLIGLTDKAYQNILRDDYNNLKSYVGDLKQIINESSAELEKDFGKLKCELQVSDSEKMVLGWKEITLLLMAIGSQTLTIRGSEKSAYGKLFEKLVLGSLLYILDFRFVSRNENKDLNKVFWLSSREDKRESDATLIFKPGKGIRFDIGFIGRGNPEISLDKVSRFEREYEYGRMKHVMATVILVDRIGRKRRIYEMAKRIDGTIVQMSTTYWPKSIAQKLKDILGYENEILGVPNEKLREYIGKKLKSAPLEEFIK